RPMTFEGRFDAEDSEIDPLVDRVKQEIRGLIALGLSQRKSWFF
ncbi:MAG: hypothetical protein QOD06_3254, partial [Candidatus Binatota bacterium]|nr:hypothetical protein [Candidatus Binatota bacterium]